MNAPRTLALAILLTAAAGTTALLAWPHPPAPRSAVRLVPKPRPAPKPAAKSTPAPFVVRRVLDTHGPIPFGRWFWDEAGVPAGPTLVTVDTEAQVLSIFRGGYEIGTTAVIYGLDSKPTPLGRFPVLMKDAHHFSRTYDNAPMPFTLRLTGDGVSIHGASVTADHATHGCIGVPTPFAAKLFAAVKVGDPVVITRGKRMAVDASPPRT